MLASPEVTVYNILGRLVNDISQEDSATKMKLKRFLHGVGNAIYRGGREIVKNYTVAGRTIGAAVEALNVPAQNPFYPANEEIASISDLRESLEKAVKRRLDDENKKFKEENRKKGIIIFVDDLDRLNPPVAVEILELLKNVFTLQNCIFILAIDYEVVVKGLEPKFGKLTNQNEREFRSFFDKIIQVPFSLPVSSYDPMTFVMDSLRDISYFPDKNELTEDLKDWVKDVIGASVGNNPRSIKRLINTLSLLDCIKKAKQGDENNNITSEELPTRDSDSEKLLNIIIVAIQICYPRIYTLLVQKPNFTEWDSEFATREGITLVDYGEDSNWIDVVKAVCSANKYLAQRYLDISKLFSMIIDRVEEDINNGTRTKSIGATLTDILNHASVTGVRESAKDEALDKKAFIRKLHANVERRIHQLRPDIEEIRARNNTGKGGFNFSTGDGRKYDVTFVPDNSENNAVTLDLELSTRIMRPEERLGMSLDDLMEDARLAKAVYEFDLKISPLLHHKSFTSVLSKGVKIKSYLDELRVFHEEGSMSGDVTHDAKYRITLQRPSAFEDRDIIDAIANAVIANYDFRNALSGWK